RIQGVVAIRRVAVEEMLGIVDHFFAVILQVADGLGDDFEVFFQRDTERALHVKVPALAEDRNCGRAGFDQGLHVAVLVDPVLGKARGTEGGEARVRELQFLRGAREEFLVFRIGTRPAAFNIIDSQLIQFLRNDELVIHGERDGLALRAVPESGIEREDFHINYAWAGLEAWSSGTPTSFFFLRNGIIARNSAPTFSIGWLRASSRMARKFLRPVLFSSIHLRANSPDWISERIFFISARVCSVTMRGPRV